MIMHIDVKITRFFPKFFFIYISTLNSKVRILVLTAFTESSNVINILDTGTVSLKTVNSI